MSARFTDAEIAAYIAECKPITPGFRPSIRLKPKRGHDERELDIRGIDGTPFQIVLRQNQINRLDFSCILALIPSAGPLFRLRRYNGKSHEHSNIIEPIKFYDFHIHEATERYQVLGAREDHFAVPADGYCDLNGAIRCMLRECGFKAEDDPQLDLFGGVLC